MALTDTYQYPPELFELLVELLPKLVRSKQGTLDWLRGAGVPDALLADLRVELAAVPSTFRKATAVRTVLNRINESTDRYLAVRREIIKRTTEFEDFSVCWENDRLPAEGLVARVRDIVNKKDSFTRMNLEREAEARKRREASEKQSLEVQAKRATLAVVQRDLAAQFSATDPHARGRALESILSRYFELEGILVREPFALTADDGSGIQEQIDGVVELESHLYLVEMKWWNEKVSPKEVSYHMVQVTHRGAVRGIFISASSYTPAAVAICREHLQERLIVLIELEELVLVLERQVSLKEYLLQKIRAAAIQKEPLYRPNI